MRGLIDFTFDFVVGTIMTFIFFGVCSFVMAAIHLVINGPVHGY